MWVRNQAPSRSLSDLRSRKGHYSWLLCAAATRKPLLQDLIIKCKTNKKGGITRVERKSRARGKCDVYQSCRDWGFLFLINRLTCLIFCSDHHMSLLNIEGSSLAMYTASPAPPSISATWPQVTFSEPLERWINGYLFIASFPAFGVGWRQEGGK